MAVFCILDKIVKFRQICKNSNFQLACRHFTIVNNENNRIHQKNVILSEGFIIPNISWYKTTKLLNKNKNCCVPLVHINFYCKNSINDFRAQEEKREDEFSKQQQQEEKPEKEQNKSQDTEKIDNLRLEILNAALPFVIKYGWTRDAIVKGAECLGYPGVVHGMFPNGGVELIQHFYSDCNSKLLEYLKSTHKDQAQVSNPTKFVANAVEFRLRLLEPYLSNWPQAIAIMSLPQNVPTALANLLTMVDDICYYSGDRSVNISWYTRRIGLAVIFKMAELYLLQDKSLNHQSTWTFLGRLMDDAVFLQSLLSQSEDATNNVQKSISSAFITARNILRLDYKTDKR